MINYHNYYDENKDQIVILKCKYYLYFWIKLFYHWYYL
jgi:hypothetical protein